jgi:putative ABC transport system permease protein
MSLWTDIRERALALVRGTRLDREHQEEVRFHLEMQARKYQQAGLPPDEARRRAAVDFGGRVRAREAAREARGVGALEDLGRDLQHGLRQLRRSPSFTIVACLTLALGIGATTAIFTVVDRVLLRPVPFADAKELVMVWETDRASGTTREPASWPDFVDFTGRARTLRGMAAFVSQEVNITADGAEPDRMSGMRTTHQFFPLLGITPVVGRTYTAGEDRPGAGAVALISESAWRGRFNADPAILQRTIRVDDVPTQIIGVVPDETDFGMDQVHELAAYHAPYAAAGRVDLWMPLGADERVLPRDTHPIIVIGRLAPSASVATAQTEFTEITADLERAYPVNVNRGAFIESFDDAVFARSRPLLYLLLVAVTLFLLVACVNVANLLLARSTTRVREVAVRGALGASGRRLTRQFMAESVLLALIGSVAGVGLAHFGLRALLGFAPPDIPRLGEAGLDGRVLLTSLVLTILVGLTFGMVPVLQALRVDVMGILRGEAGAVSQGRERRRLREGLVVAELAMSVALAICAGLVLRSFASVMNVDAGFNAEGVLKAQYQLPESRYPRDFSKFPNFTEILQFDQRLLARVRALPGVESAAIASAHPLDAGFTNSWRVIGREAEAAEWPEISVRVTTPSYFGTMGLSLIKGRLLQDTDDTHAPAVAVINATTAKRFFASQEPIGQRLAFWGLPRLIVGVVQDERIHGLTEATPAATYIPLAQAPASSGVLLVRGAGDPMRLAGSVRQAIRDTDPQLAVYGLEPFTATVLTSVGQRRFAVLVLGVFAVVTMALALIGIHGVVSYVAAQRTREIGIRLALGASRRSVIALVIRGGLVLAFAGIVAGLAGAVAGSRLLTGLLFGVSRVDPVTFVVVPLAVVAATLAATWLPARRAARAAPLTAIRSE